MRRCERLRASGLEANQRGDYRGALRMLLQAAMIKPSCAMLLSVANMHLKLEHPTLAAPLYYFVLTCEGATEREAGMAAAKLKVPPPHPLADAHRSAPSPPFTARIAARLV